MPSVLLDGFLGGSAGRTPLGQPDPETRTGRTKPQISTRKPESDGQQPPGPARPRPKPSLVPAMCLAGREYVHITITSVRQNGGNIGNAGAEYLPIHAY